MLTRLAYALWTASARPAAYAFRRALADPEAAQRAILRRYLRANADTAYGRRYGFADTRTYADFARRVPLTAYDDYAGHVADIRAGRPGVLTRAPVRRLVPTSGSAAAEKLIPYTRDLTREFGRAISPWVVDLFSHQPDLRDGPAYWSVSPVARPPREPSAVPVGFDDDSAYLGRLARPVAAATLAVPDALAHVPDVDAFRYVTLLLLLRAPALRLISVWHPSFLTLLLDRLPPLYPALVRDVATGGCGVPLPPRVGARLRPWFRRPLPGRARALERLSPAEPAGLWPALRVISCWAHAHAGTCVPAVQGLFPRAVIQPKGLIATEGVITLPVTRAGRTVHPLAVRSHFFEFLDDSGRARLAHELRPGDAAEVVVTTAGGLYRYRLHDRVRVVDMIDETPCLEFLGKGDLVCDLCGEKLAEGFVAGALAAVFGRAGLRPAFAHVAPAAAPARPPHYTLFIECEGVPAALGAAADAELRKSEHYDYCRALGQLGPLQVVRLPRGAHERYFRAIQSRGQRLGNIKPRALDSGRDWETILFN